MEEEITTHVMYTVRWWVTYLSFKDVRILFRCLIIQVFAL